MHPMLNIAIQAARKAGQRILLANNHRDRIEVREKSANNLVTNIDLEVEQIILDILKTANPKQYFITEESGAFGNADSNYTWIIDPIDGTNNFIHALPHHCVSIAMQYHKKTEVAVVYNPYLDQLFTAQRGRGAQLNGHRLRVAKRDGLPRCLLSGALRYSNKLFDETYPQAILELHNKISGLRYSGSLALDMCYVAAGYLDGLWTSRNAKIWDIAAADLIIRESGGIVCAINGAGDYLSHGQLIAGNPKIVSKLTQFLHPHLVK